MGIYRPFSTVDLQGLLRAHTNVNDPTGSLVPNVYDSDGCRWVSRNGILTTMLGNRTVDRSGDSTGTFVFRDGLAYYCHIDTDTDTFRIDSYDLTDLSLTTNLYTNDLVFSGVLSHAVRAIYDPVSDRIFAVAYVSDWTFPVPGSYNGQTAIYQYDVDGDAGTRLWTRDSANLELPQVDGICADPTAGRVYAAVRDESAATDYRVQRCTINGSADQSNDFVIDSTDVNDRPSFMGPYGFYMYPDSIGTLRRFGGALTWDLSTEIPSALPLFVALDLASDPDPIKFLVFPWDATTPDDVYYVELDKAGTTFTAQSLGNTAYSAGTSLVTSGIWGQIDNQDGKGVLVDRVLSASTTGHYSLDLRRTETV